MGENIKEITEKIQAAEIEELPVLFMQYEADGRAGVRAAREKGRKRILAYEKEVARIDALY